MSREQRRKAMEQQKKKGKKKKKKRVMTDNMLISNHDPETTHCSSRLEDNHSPEY